MPAWAFAANSAALSISFFMGYPSSLIYGAFCTMQGKRGKEARTPGLEPGHRVKAGLFGPSSYFASAALTALGANLHPHRKQAVCFLAVIARAAWCWNAADLLPRSTVAI